MPTTTTTTPTQPQLGYGNQSEASIDQVNIWMRGTPWYQQLLRSWGQDPGHPHDLSDAQKAAIVKGAQANGVVVDEGSQEIDDNGNFQNQGHKLRNTLIVAGIAAATIATMGAAGVFAGAAGAGAAGAGAGGVEAGVASGLGAAALPGAGTALGAAGGAAALGSAATVPLAAGTVGGLASGSSAGGGWAGAAGGTSIFGGGGGGAAATGGLSYGDLLKYGLPAAGGLASSLIQASASGNASDAQQKYLQEALDYEKEKDTYQRGLDATALTLANQRYGDYQGRIAPWIANGTSANDRQAALLGLPARSGSSSGGGSSSSGGSSGVPVSPEITAANLANYTALGFSPTGRGTGPTDSAYYDEEIAATGGLTPANTAYWFGANGRIAQDAAKAGVKASAAPPSTTTAPTAPATPPPVTTQPQAQTNTDPMVTMRGPDGSTKQVPQSQVVHYQSLGATLQSGAA